MSDPSSGPTEGSPRETVQALKPEHRVDWAPVERPVTRRRRLLIWGGLAVALLGSVSILHIARQRSMRDLSWLVREAAARHGLEAEFIEAVVHAESGGNPRAVSHAQAYGLMQLKVGTAAEVAGRDVTTEELFEPRFNLEMGCRYMKKMLLRFGNDARMALMAYNAGPGRLDSWRTESGSDDAQLILDRFAFKQTRAYVYKVLEYRKGLLESRSE